MFHSALESGDVDHPQGPNARKGGTAAASLGLLLLAAGTHRRHVYRPNCLIARSSNNRPSQQLFISASPFSAFPLFALRFLLPPLSLHRRVSNGNRGVVFFDPPFASHARSEPRQSASPAARVAGEPPLSAHSTTNDHRAGPTHRRRRAPSISIPSPIDAAAPGAGMVAMKDMR